MPIITIRLPRGEWRYDSDQPLGPRGGFGIVFAGEADGFEPLAIKKLHISAAGAAHREMQIADEFAGHELQNIIPIHDAGLDTETGSYFIVMDRAEKSLQDEIDQGRLFDEKAAIDILLDVTAGLTEADELVHRDLKPGNILFHGNKWKIADFGIAKFVENATSSRTLQECLTPQYAAPEQWLVERATHATDVYAIGCIFFALLTGKPPFSGTRDELSEKHRLAIPPLLPESTSPQIKSLVSMLLRKLPAARPRLERVVMLLRRAKTQSIQNDKKYGFDALAKAGHAIASAEAEAEAKKEETRARKNARRQLSASAIQILNELTTELFEQIENVAPSVQRRSDREIVLGTGSIRVGQIFPDRIAARKVLLRSNWNILIGTSIEIRQYNGYSSSSNLWYMDPSGDNQYRWYEVSYFNSPLIRRGQRMEPFHLDNYEDAALVASPGACSFQIAWGPRIIDDEDAQDFFDHWSSLLARAAQGQLRRPRSLPLKEPL